MVNKSLLAKRIHYGVARACDFEALGRDEVLAIKRDSGVVHRRFSEREVKELGEREFEHHATTEHVDGMGDIVKSTGADLLRLKTGRVPLFWGHDSSPVPMGLVNSGKRGKCADGKRALITRSSTYEPELYNDSEWGKHVASIVTLMQRGDMPGVSIGFIPKSVRWPEKEEREELGMGQWGVVFEEWELYELSVTPIPCNPYAQETKEIDRMKAALAEMVSAKQISAEEATWMQRALAQSEDEFLAGLPTRTIIPLARELPWLKGGELTPKASTSATAPATSERGEAVFRGIVRDEVAAVSQTALAPLTASMLRVEEQLAAIRAVQQPLSQTDANRGETDGREVHCPPTERSTGTSREADPTTFHRALLESAIGTVTSKQGPDRNGRHRDPAQGAGDQPAQGSQRGLDQAQR